MKTLIIALHVVVATIYHAVPGQTDDTPDITATGFVIDLNNPKKHRIVAVSRDLEKIGFVIFGNAVLDKCDSKIRGL